MSTQPESELTAKAREVLAGLSEPMRGRLRNIVEGGGVPWGYASGAHSRLAALGLAFNGAPAGFRGSAHATDLGREVARLLSEVRSK